MAAEKANYTVTGVITLPDGTQIHGTNMEIVPPRVRLQVVKRDQQPDSSELSPLDPEELLTKPLSEALNYGTRDQLVAWGRSLGAALYRKCPVWTKERIDLHYKSIVARFGAYAQWEHRTYPRTQKEYADFNESLLNEIKKLPAERDPTSRDALANQKEWAITYQPKLSLGTWLRNVIGAIDSGFIDSPQVAPKILKLPRGSE